MNSQWDDEVANETLLTPVNTHIYPQIIPKKTPQQILRRRELRKLQDSRDIEEEKTKTNRTTQVTSKESLTWLAHLDTTPWSLNF